MNLSRDERIARLAKQLERLADAAAQLAQLGDDEPGRMRWIKAIRVAGRAIMRDQFGNDPVARDAVDTALGVQESKPGV